MGPPAGTQRARHLAARRARRPLQPPAARERRLPGPRQPRSRIDRSLRAGRDDTGHHRRCNRVDRCRIGGRRAPLSQRCARAVARGLAEPRHRALPRALLAALRRRRRPGLRRLGRAQARGERCQGLDQGRAVARGDVPLSARGRFRGGELRAGLQIKYAVERHAKASVLDQGGRTLENSVRRSRMKLKYLFALSTAAVVPAALAAEAQAGVKGGLQNEPGSVAMARTADPNSATAQFFINVGDNSFLNWGDPRSDGNGYAVFGKVVSGLDVVTKIAKTPTGPGGPFPRDVPRSPVVIESMTLVSGK